MTYILNISKGMMACYLKNDISLNELLVGIFLNLVLLYYTLGLWLTATCRC